jgi:hypothetical protein
LEREVVRAGTRRFGRYFPGPIQVQRSPRGLKFEKQFLHALITNGFILGESSL